MSIQEKKHEIVSLLDDLPKSTLDHVLRLLKEEGRPLSKVSKSIINGLKGKGIKLPLERKIPKVHRDPIITKHA